MVFAYVLMFCHHICFQAAIWTLRWPLPCACLEESAGGSFPCTSSFRQSVLFSVLQSFLACTMVRNVSRSTFRETLLLQADNQDLCLRFQKVWESYLNTLSTPKMFCAIFCCFFYTDALWDYPGAFNVTGPNATAGIFATYPGKHLTIVNGFFDQVFLWNYAQNRNFNIMMIHLI